MSSVYKPCSILSHDTVWVAIAVLKMAKESQDILSTTIATSSIQECNLITSSTFQWDTAVHQMLEVGCACETNGRHDLITQGWTDQDTYTHSSVSTLKSTIVSFWVGAALVCYLHVCRQQYTLKLVDVIVNNLLTITILAYNAQQNNILVILLVRCHILHAGYPLHCLHCSLWLL